MGSPSLPPETLRLWLEWAGGKLLALPAGKLRPQKIRALWPEYAQDPFEVLYFRPKESLSVRLAAPTAEEIPLMDRIMVLPNLCDDIRFRRVLHARSLVYPYNGRYLYPWTRLANVMHISRITARTWHQKGLTSVCCMIPGNERREIEDFFTK